MEKIKRVKLKSGLEILFVVDPRFTTSTVQMSFNVGWRHDDEKFLGLAHLFEHLVGKRTLKYPGKSEFELKREEMGIVNNAWTGPDQTLYYHNHIPGKLFESLKLLYEAIYNSTFDEEDLEKEKGVVMNEAKRYLDNDDSLLWHESIKTLYPKSSMSKFFFGTDTTMKNITKQVFENFYEYYRNPKNGYLIIGTNISESEKIISFLNDFYKNYKNSSKKVFHKVEDKFTPSKKELVINKPDKTQANIRLLLKMEKMSKVERVAFVVVKRILVGGLTARLYKKLRDELGLIYAISIGHDSFHGDVRFVTIATQVAKEKVEELIDVVFSEIQKAIKEVDQKEVKKIIPIIEYYESLEVNVNNIVDGVIDSHNYKYEYINSKEFLKLLGKVKASEVKKLMQKIFVKEKLVKVVLK